MQLYWKYWAMRALGAFAMLLVSLSQGMSQPFTYQGLLRDGGVPANGMYDFRFRLWNAASGGAQVGSDQFVNDLNVQNGLFTTELNFASVWDGSDRYLEIAVRPGASTGAYTVLSPRVRITPTPYAIRANTAGTANPIGAAGGDLSGTYPNPTVARLQGRSVASDAPADGQVLKWSAANNRWEPAVDLRDAFWQGASGNIFYTGGNVGIGTGSPVYRLQVETNIGDVAIAGYNTAISGVNAGVYGQSVSTLGSGVFGRALASTGATIGVWGRSDSSSGTGVLGSVAATTGVHYGVRGQVQSSSFDSAGVFGQATAGWGVRGLSNTGTGVYGQAAATVGTTYGMYGQTDSNSGVGVFGTATSTSGLTYGVRGENSSSAGRGVYGWAIATSGTTYGVYGQSDSTAGTGVLGWATSVSGFSHGVWGRNDSSMGKGVYGWATATSGAAYGVYGQSDSTSGRGVYGWASATTGTVYGVYGESSSPSAGYGVFFINRLAGTGTKSFQMDHPLRPETHYLNHFCAEGPEPYNIYRGTATLDARGEAWIQLPDYYEAINRDPTYHLTPIGASMPNLYVAVEIQGNRFKIAGGVPGKKVSWEVKAVRNDLWVQRYGYQAEPEKPEEHQGKYLHPELYGQPKERGVHYHPEREQPATPEKPL